MADHDKMIEDQQQALAEAYDASFAEGAKAERARISAILNCEEAGPRQRLAMKLALETDMTLEHAREFMDGLPVERKISSVRTLAERYAENPGFGGDARDPETIHLRHSAEQIRQRSVERANAKRGVDRPAPPEAPEG